MTEETRTESAAWLTMAGKRCLVTGASGFMGQYMVRHLLDAGAVVVGTDVLPAPPARLFHEHRDYSHVQADLTLPWEANRAVVAGEPFDTVFHVAALFDYSAPQTLLHKVNVEGSLNLVRLIASQSERRPRLVFWGAGGIYDFDSQWYENGMPEGALISSSLDGYLLSKYEAEQVLEAACTEQRIPLTVIRLGGVYGPGARYGVAVAMKLASQGAMGPIYIGPQNVRASTVHAKDVAGAAAWLALRPSAANETYNVADGSAYTTAHLMRRCASALGFPMIPRVALPMAAMRAFVKNLGREATKLGRVPLLTADLIELQGKDALLDSSKLRATGWTPSVPDALVGLLETIDAERKSGWLS